MVRRDRGWVALLVATALIATAAGLLLPAALAAALDSVRAGGSAVLWVVVLGAVGILAEVAGVVLTARVTANATARLRADLGDHLVRLGTHSDFADGDAVSRITGDCIGAGQIAALAVQLLGALLMSAGAITALALLDWRLAAVFLCAVPLALLLARSHLRLTAADVQAYQEVSGELGARLLDAVAGLRTITAAGVADQETARVLRPLPRLSAAGAGMWRTQARMVWRAGLLMPAVQVTVLAAAGFGVLTGRLTIGDMLAALGYAVLGLGVVRQIPLLTTLSRARSCASRIAAVLDTPAEDSAGQALPPGPGVVEVRRVGVDGALSEVDFVIPAGTAVAVVGRSGSGKSVLASVLAGLRRPDRGEVRLDGVPLSAVADADLRATIGCAFERPALLGSSVRAAVAYGVTADEAAVRAACRLAQVDDLVVRLPDGYATPLSRTPLSGGEAQRLGLARAVVRTPRLLVLDDATASLDTVTEAQVEAALAARPHTRVTITHRAGVASRADLVVWLDGGRVRGFGPHDVLWGESAYRAVFTEEEAR
ncbi:ABC transporter ATP-binding protein [Actinokineospora iranica]|uniref:ATP-binding cassette, subfamily B n=1 Tax=Actinokineospora iranica TaxID=1271860 RepID=A0A1G6Y079_9PSEU|nr:ABC transporter ATP-binding protein [Actinokineospora iranica]SDD83353.1 ATP-binding cassette, subfamily B [Actinokineospora iranica]